ncbi:alginate lyase family protein [Halobacillus massiliensis]|uniref:alginate lyase family protein n=1 Tax=Halobacillus massiliensis TaxID=1926286 RepID=UPI0015C4C8CC|nr:alginate lyase family protein [Halobacillus massiliensis]
MRKSTAKYFHTIIHLKKTQIFFRLYNTVKPRTKIKSKKNIKVNLDIQYLLKELDMEPKFLVKFDSFSILKDSYTLINKIYKEDIERLWNNKEINKLWLYNLHYLEFLLPLLYEYKRSNDEKYYNKMKEIVYSWLKNSKNKSSLSWDPYTISMRLPNLIIFYQFATANEDPESEFMRGLRTSIFDQYFYLQRNKERHLLGNHYIENIKALILGSIFFQEYRVTDKCFKLLMQELDEQILDDGMHFELSPMYNKVIYEALLKIIYWLKQNGNDRYVKLLIPYAQRMLNSVYSIETKMGKTPFFNDSADGISKSYLALCEASYIYLGISPNKVMNFNSSGYRILERGSKKMLVDYGEIGPKYLPGHGHCDSLSYELSIDEVPIIVNSGTFEYENGFWRNYFRKTDSHNTIKYEGIDQSEIWNSFRVAKRSYNHKGLDINYNDYNFFVGSYYNYKGDKHSRFIAYLDDENILILDKLSPTYKKVASGYIHFHPMFYLSDNILYNTKNKQQVLKIHPIFCNSYTNNYKNGNATKSYYSEQFNLKKPISKYVLTADKEDNYFGYIINFNNEPISINASEELLTVTINNKNFYFNLSKLFSIKF